MKNDRNKEKGKDTCFRKTTLCPKRESGRRYFLKKATMGTLGISAMFLNNFSCKSGTKSNVSSVSKIPVIDTHTHCFDGPASTRFPYHEKASYKPETIATPEQLLLCMDGAGVDFGVIVNPEPYQDDHRYLEYCLNIGKGRLKGTILVFSDRPGSMDQLPLMAKRGDIIAVRIHAYLPDRLPPFGKPEFHRLWKMAADNGLAVQLNFLPQYANGFVNYIKEFRDVRVIIDHLGHPMEAGSAKEYSVIERWGGFTNTIIKLSNLGVISDHPDPVVKQYVNQMIKAYGTDRMIWGSDHKTGSTPEIYRSKLEHAKSFLAEFSKEDQDKVFGGNAFRLFGKGWDQAESRAV
jgi:predicted TIM-barrel fold metal-dependent hydrolase